MSARIVATGLVRHSLLIAFLLGCAYGAHIVLPFVSVEGWWWAPGTLGADVRTYIIYGTVFGLIVSAFGMFAVLFATFTRALVRFDLPLLFVVYGAGGVWVLLEFVREVVFYGSSWGHIAYLFHWNTPLIQNASWGGVYVIGFAVVAGTVGCGLSLYRYVYGGAQNVDKPLSSDTKVSSPPAITGLSAYTWKLVPLLIGLLPLITLHIYGAIALSVTPQSGTERTVAVLHSTLTSVAGATRQGFETHEALIRDALLQQPDLLLLPENIFPAITIDPTDGTPTARASEPARALHDRLNALLRTSPGTLVVIGVHAQEDDRVYNTLAGYRDGELTHFYRKRVLMPFGEIAPSFLQEGHLFGMSTGERTQSWQDRAFGTIASLICSEGAYTRLAGKTVGGVSPSFILIASNDTIFSHPRIGRMQHTQARFRAIEERAYVARSVKGGISSIIDPYGREIVHSREQHGSGILSATIVLPR